MGYQVAVHTNTGLAHQVTIARALVSHVFYCHGIAKRIHADQGRNLSISKVLQGVTNLLGISRSLLIPKGTVKSNDSTDFLSNRCIA